LVYCEQSGILTGGCRVATIEEWQNLDLKPLTSQDVKYYRNVTLPFINMVVFKENDK